MWLPKVSTKFDCEKLDRLKNEACYANVKPFCSFKYFRNKLLDSQYSAGIYLLKVNAGWVESLIELITCKKYLYKDKRMSILKIRSRVRIWMILR